jgi:hypothetical protein
MMGGSKVAISPQIENAEQNAINGVFDHPGNALTHVSGTEKHIYQDKAHHPRQSRIPAKPSDTIHQITAIDHFFAERGERPSEGKAYEEHFRIVAEDLELGEIGHFAAQADEKGLRYK